MFLSLQTTLNSAQSLIQGESEITIFYRPLQACFLQNLLRQYELRHLDMQNYNRKSSVEAHVEWPQTGPNMTPGRRKGAPHYKINIESKK